MKGRKAELILLGIVGLLLAASAVISLLQDRTAPVFLYSEDKIVYREGEDESILLTGLRAMDEHDGDVSARIIVDNIIPPADRDQAKIFYAVSDLSGNVTETGRIVDYRASEPTGFPDRQEDKTHSAESEILSTEESADTSADETREAEESTTEEESTTAEPGREGFPVLTLTTHEVTLKVGETFSYYNYLKSAVDDKDTRSELYRRINIQGTYDTSKAGEYELTFFVVDSDGNRSNREKLILIVE